MKKILFSLIALCCAMSLNAQTMKIYKGGTLVSTYTSNNADKVEFKETNNVSSITLDKTSKSIEEGNTFTLTVTAQPNDADDKSVNWESSNSSVATVENGIVTAIKAGSATITATANDGSEANASCQVTVTKKNIKISFITLNNSTESIVEGNSTTLTVTILPDNADDKSLTWSSSNTSVATVTNGVVTTINAGSATITAAANDGSG